MLVGVTGAGCAPAPLARSDLGGPELRAIHDAFVRTVARTYADPDRSWSSGWAGNVWVNFAGGTNRGLCYEWRDAVYDGVKDAVAARGWDLTGIAINVGTGSEHHAVLVFDPRVVGRERLLAQPAPRHGYVLDAWLRGGPDIWRLDDWVNIPLGIVRPAELEDLPYAYPG
ncbi:MAG: hypothetical protein JNM07_12825 [Phycisphaerae bacterium]|nr:hypothetical protein [Phycisphaerae bacterium]